MADPKPRVTDADVIRARQWLAGRGLLSPDDRDSESLALFCAKVRAETLERAAKNVEEWRHPQATYLAGEIRRLGDE